MNAKFESDVFGLYLHTPDEINVAKAAIVEFVRRVNAQAEQNMLKTGKLEGAHHAAMKQQLKEWGIDL